jgi:hypothetical protein
MTWFPEENISANTNGKKYIYLKPGRLTNVWSREMSMKLAGRMRWETYKICPIPVPRKLARSIMKKIKD